MTGVYDKCGTGSPALTINEFVVVDFLTDYFTP